MALKLVEHPLTRRVTPQSVLDYDIFSKSFHGPTDVREMNLFERFITATRFIRQGYETYLDPFFKSDPEPSSLHADACGIGENEIIVAFCTVGFPDSQVWNAIRRVSESENATALIVSSEEVDLETVEEEAPGAMTKGKVKLETLGWFDDTLEKTLRETLRTIELLVNETRMRMLTPLLQKSALKKEFRARINPKLVYHNIDALSRAGLLEEPVEGTYELSHLGKTVLSDFIAFLERTRRTLDEQRNEEVKSIGRR